MCGLKELKEDYENILKLETEYNYNAHKIHDIQHTFHSCYPYVKTSEHELLEKINGNLGVEISKIKIKYKDLFSDVMCDHYESSAFTDFLLVLIRFSEKRVGYCEWKYDDYEDCYDTKCGNSFVISEGTPSNNDMKYCCYCGKTIKEVENKC